MLSLHETTRRRLCRTGFVALCVVPTVLVLAWIAWVLSPGQKQAHEQALTEKLGLTATLGRLSFPRPGVTLYEDLRLADPETGKRIASVRVLEIDENGPAVILTASQPQISGQRLDALWDVIERRLRLSTASATPWRLAECDVTVHLGSGSRTFSNVRSQFESLKNSPRFAMRFRISGLDMPQDAAIRVWRARADSAAATNIELDTGSAPLPCSLAASVWPAVERLGKEARLRGSIWARETPAGWQGGLKGQLVNLDLYTLISEQFPHNLTGAAELTIDEALCQHGRLEQATGSLVAGPGRISRSLVDAAQRALHLTSEAKPKTVGSSWAYERLALAFAIDSRGLVIEGQCQNYPGAVLVDRDQVLLAQPEAPQPVVSLVRMLVPQNDVQVPATRQTDELTQRLPIPAIVLPNGTQPPPRATGLRVGRKN